MRLVLAITFRGKPADVRGRLPAELAFLGRGLGRRCLPFGPPECAGQFAVDEATAERIIAWGRRRAAGKTLIRVARYLEEFEPSDLDASGWAEVRRPWGQQVPEVTNAPSAFRGRWACSRCDRVALEQVGDLELASPAEDDVQMTERGDLVVRSGLRDVIEEAGVSTRPVRDADFVQLVPPPVALLVGDLFPLTRGRPCPGCGREAVARSEVVEGSYVESNESDLWVAREWPLPIDSRGWGESAMAASSEPIGWHGRVTDEPRHRPGEEFGLGEERGWTNSGCPALFARPHLVRMLLERGASGLSYRPARAISSSDCSDEGPSHRPEKRA